MKLEKANTDRVISELTTTYRKELVKEFMEVEEVQPSENMDSWLNNLIMDPMRKKTPFNLRRIAVFVVVFLSILITFSIGSEALRKDFLSFFMKNEDEYTYISINDEAEIKSYIDDVWDDAYLPEWIPEGYRLDEAYELSTTRFVVYVSGEEDIYFTQGSESRYFDSENGQYEQVLIGDLHGFLIIKENRKILYWHNDNVFFSLTAESEIEILIEIAKSIKKIT